MTASRALSLALTISSATLAACGPAIRSDRDEAIPVPQGATWMWGSRPAQPGEEPAAGMGDDIVRQRFERAITVTMQAKGFRRVTEAAEAIFVLTLAYEPGRPPGTRLGLGGISIGIMGGWGGGWGRPRYGGYPYGWSGWYDPWGWNWWAPLWMTPTAYPGQGPAANREGALVAKLRQRESGYVAWIGRVATSAVGSQHLSQRRVQAIVDRLFRTLR